MTENTHGQTRRGLSRRNSTTCGPIAQLPIQPFLSDFASNFSNISGEKEVCWWETISNAAWSETEKCWESNRVMCLRVIHGLVSNLLMVLIKSLVIAQVRVQFIWDGAWDSAFPPGPPRCCVVSWNGSVRHSLNILVLECKASYIKWLAVTYLSKLSRVDIF